MNYIVKTICNPRMVTNYISPHYPQYRLGAISVDSTGQSRAKGWCCLNVTFTNIRLNHYFCKSKEDYIIKVSRGLGDRDGRYSMDKFDQLNFNDVYDDCMLVYKKDLYLTLNIYESTSVSPLH